MPCEFAPSHILATYKGRLLIERGAICDALLPPQANCLCLGVLVTPWFQHQVGKLRAPIQLSFTDSFVMTARSTSWNATQPRTGWDRNLSDTLITSLDWNKSSGIPSDATVQTLLYSHFPTWLPTACHCVSGFRSLNLSLGPPPYTEYEELTVDQKSLNDTPQHLPLSASFVCGGCGDSASFAPLPKLPTNISSDGRSSPTKQLTCATPPTQTLLNRTLSSIVMPSDLSGSIQSSSTKLPTIATAALTSGYNTTIMSFTTSVAASASAWKPEISPMPASLGSRTDCILWRALLGYGSATLVASCLVLRM